MHVGRVGDPALLPDALVPVGPSAVAAQGRIYTHEGPKPFAVPHELSEQEISAIVQDFADAARNAVAAGFDAVEIHGTNGYLVHQFLASGANQRTDSWGGSVEGRVRFAVEVTAVVVDAIGGDKVGIRLSPGNPLHDIAEDDHEAVYTTLLACLGGMGLAYVHVLEVPGQRDLVLRMRREWPATFILNPVTESRPAGPEELHPSRRRDRRPDLVRRTVPGQPRPSSPARHRRAVQRARARRVLRRRPPGLHRLPDPQLTIW